MTPAACSAAARPDHVPDAIVNAALAAPAPLAAPTMRSRDRVSPAAQRPGTPVQHDSSAGRRPPVPRTVPSWTKPTSKRWLNGSMPRRSSAMKKFGIAVRMVRGRPRAPDRGSRRRDRAARRGRGSPPTDAAHRADGARPADRDDLAVLVGEGRGAEIAVLVQRGALRDDPVVVGELHAGQARADLRAEQVAVAGADIGAQRAAAERAAAGGEDRPRPPRCARRAPVDGGRRPRPGRALVVDEQLERGRVVEDPHADARRPAAKRAAVDRALDHRA